MIYGVIEMDDAGSDLESLAKPSAFQVFDAFWMSVLLLAVVEKECEFEHRDLHMSNICFRERVVGSGYDVGPDDVRKMGVEPDVMLGLTNLKITIIDYTMSRLRTRAGEGEGGGGRGEGEGEGRVLFNPESAWSGSSHGYNHDEDEGTIRDPKGDHQTITGQRMRRLALAHSQSQLKAQASSQQILSSPPQHKTPEISSATDTSFSKSKWSNHIPPHKRRLARPPSLSAPATSWRPSTACTWIKPVRQEAADTHVEGVTRGVAGY